ncbi:MAG: DUF937 domain-containing protein [Bacteroidales bacterium]
MLENLLGTLKSEVGGQILNQAQLPQTHLDGVFKVLGDVAKKEVTGHILGGGLENVMNLFSNQTNNAAANQIQSNLHSGVIDGLVSKLGISPDMAKNVAATAVPALINMITQKNSATPDNDPSPLHEIFGTAQKTGLGGLLGKLFNKQ